MQKQCASLTPLVARPIPAATLFQANKIFRASGAKLILGLCYCSENYELDWFMRDGIKASASKHAIQHTHGQAHHTESNDVLS